MDQDDPEQRVAGLEHRLAQQRHISQPEAWQAAAVQPPGLTADDVRNVTFSDAAVGERGYDHDQVDAFIDHIAGAFDGQTGPTMTAEWVRSIAFTTQPPRKHGYDVAEVDAFVDRVEFELARRARQQPVAYPGAAGSQPPGAAAAARPPADSAEPGVDNRVESRRRGFAIGDLVPGLIDRLIDFVYVLFRDENTEIPNWMVPVFGVLFVVFGVVAGWANGIWIGIAALGVSAIYLCFKWVWKLVWKPAPRDDQSPPGRHSA